MPLRPRWSDDPRGDEVFTLPESDYCAVLAAAAQRCAGQLASAMSSGDEPTQRLRLDELVHVVGTLQSYFASSAPHKRMLARGEAFATLPEDPEWGLRLFTGTPSLWDGVRPLLSGARFADIVVAYATREGVRLVRPALLSAASAGCTVRILAGCYLGGTVPDALRALLDLQDAHERIRVRFLDDPAVHFHPKVYRVVDGAGTRHLFVGSSNLSRSALLGDRGAVEWNLALDDMVAVQILEQAERSLAQMLATTGVPLDASVIEAFEARVESSLPHATMLDTAFEVARVPSANEAQLQALEALRKVREAGETRALVVAATGLGKTMLAALDSRDVVPPGNGHRVLFVAHRIELLQQARLTFRCVRGGDHGLVADGVRATDAEHVYASIASLNALTDESLASFDYIIVDEAHHSAAESYRRLFGKNVRPRFTLGLTATPERHDGGDIYALFDNVVAYEATLLQAIGRGWLSPFRYYGLPDSVDYSKLKWVGGSLGYRESDLTRELTADVRMNEVLSALREPAHSASRSLVYCVSIEHARQTCRALRDAGMRVTAIHTGSNELPREEAIRRLRVGELDAIVSVDVFNEGVDVPEVDRVVLLRPTDSATVFLQQIGRGMRLSSATGKDHVKIVDFVGNHRRARNRLGLLGVTRQDVLAPADGAPMHRAWDDGREVYLAPQALEAVRAVEGILGGPRARILDALRELRDEARATGAARPRLLDVVSRTGLAPTTISQLFGSWFQLLAEQDALDPPDREIVRSAAASAMLKEVEGTEMSGPHKMLLLGALAELGRTVIDIETAREAMREFVEHRHPSVQARRQGQWKPFALNKDVPKKYPMEVLAKGQPRFFALRGDEFELKVPDGVSAIPLLDAIGEIAAARLYQFVRVRGGGAEVEGRLVKQGSSGVFLQLKDQARRLGAAGTWIPIFVEGKEYRAKVVEIAINVIHDPTEPRGRNIATEVLLRAAGARTVPEGLGRYLRFLPLADGGFEVESV